jgi:hypothetical protein
MPTLASKIIATINTNIGSSCPLCRTFLDGSQFDECCNHLLKKHKLKCLHVGQETSRDNEGHLCYSTVAVFGASLAGPAPCGPDFCA